MSMKIKTITFSNAQNWGAILQTYALCKYINSNNFDNSCEVIEYEKFDERWFKPRKILKDVFYSVLYYKRNVHRIARYKTFITDNIPFAKEKTWKELNDSTDVFITGSDQVWNCSNGIVPEFYLEPVSDNVIKIAYAPSFGIKKIPLEYQKHIAENIKRIEYLSVRETSGQKIVKELTGRDARIVVDPVFLISENEWRTLSSDPIEKDYLFVYVTEISDKVTLLVKKYTAQNPDCKVITPYAIPGVRAIIKKDIGPAQFLGLIKNAKAVISTSFHATAFSLIFKKGFCVVPHSTTGSRVTDLLNKIGMEKAIYSDNYDLNDLSYNPVYHDKLDDWIAESKQFINKSLDLASKTLS